MKIKAVLSSAGLANGTRERWRKTNYLYNRMHFPIIGEAIYHDVNGEKLLTIGNVYLMVNSRSSDLELINNGQYYHMYVDFRTVPPLLGSELLEIDYTKDHYFMYLIKAMQTLIQENAGEDHVSIKEKSNTVVFKQLQTLLQVILLRLANKYGLQIIENPKIEEAITYIEGNYSEYISNEDIAKMLRKKE